MNSRVAFKGEEVGEFISKEDYRERRRRAAIPGAIDNYFSDSSEDDMRHAILSLPSNLRKQRLMVTTTHIPLPSAMRLPNTNKFVHGYDHRSSNNVHRNQPSINNRRSSNTISGKSVPIDDGLDRPTSSSYPKKSKRYHSMATLALLTFMALKIIRCFMDDYYYPYYQNHIIQMKSGGAPNNNKYINDVENILSWFETTISTSPHYSPEQKRRALAILKTRWPECMDLNLTSQECKELIDADIENLFTGVDKNITSHIVKVRRIEDDNYNLVVIQTSSESGGLVQGPFGDGIVYYHFDWNSTGEEATIEQQKDIPPVNGYIVDGINANASTIDEYIAGNATGHIAGGWYKSYYANTDEGQAKLDAYLSTTKTVDSSGLLRSLGPWDCAGLTGESCCALLKHDVRDSDHRNNSIQCYVDEPRADGILTRKMCEDDITKICVYEKYNGMVLRVPILAYDAEINDAIAGGYNISKSQDESGLGEAKYAVPYRYEEQT